MSQTKPSIVFAHGVWADGSCFSKVISTLQAEGYQVLASQHSLDTLDRDIAAAHRTLGRVSSPAVLVGTGTFEHKTELIAHELGLTGRLSSARLVMASAVPRLSHLVPPASRHSTAAGFERHLAALEREKEIDGVARALAPHHDEAASQVARRLDTEVLG